MENEKSKIWGIIPLLFVPILTIVMLVQTRILLSVDLTFRNGLILLAFFGITCPAWIVGLSVIFHDAFSKNKSDLYFVLCPAITFGLLLAYYLTMIFVGTEPYNDRHLCLFFIVEALPCLPLYVLSYIKRKKANTVLSNILGIAMIFLTPILYIPSQVIDFHFLQQSLTYKSFATEIGVPIFGIALLYMIISCIVVQIREHKLRKA